MDQVLLVIAAGIVAMLLVRVLWAVTSLDTPGTEPFDPNNPKRRL